jgi:hypothetical protein
MVSFPTKTVDNNGVNRGVGIPMTGISEATEEIKPNFRHLEDLGEVFLSCPSCGDDIVVIQKVSESKRKTTFIATCPCGDSSFPQLIEGETYVDAVSPKYGLADLKYDLENDTAEIIVTNVQK